jgi:hypothetical protein
MLHITNGDSVITSFKTGQIPGTYLAWRDVLHDGPVPKRDSLEALSDVRAEFLANAFGGAGYETARAEFAQRDRALASFADHDEVVLWFEHDLYDQLQLLQILSWLADHDISRGRVSLIQIGSHPDIPNFQGLGELNGAQLAALLPTRSPITARQLQIGREVWAAFCAEDPTLLSAAARRQYGPDMPFLSAALFRFLEEYPSIRDGLTRTERQLLTVIAAGTTKRKALWWASQQYETSCWGDLSVYDRLDRLADAAHPLVQRVDEQHVTLTDAGRRILDGRERRDPRETDRWLGGVHLGPGRLDWRWHEDDRTVTVSLAG